MTPSHSCPTGDTHHRASLPNATSGAGLWLLVCLVACGLLWPLVEPLIQIGLVILLLVYILLWPVNQLEKELLSVIGMLARGLKRPVFSNPDGGFTRRWSIVIRGMAIGVVFSTFSIAMLLSILILSPIIVAQGKVFIATVPGQLVTLLVNGVDWLNQVFGLNIALPVSPKHLSGQEDQVAHWLSAYLDDWLHNHTNWIQDTMSQTTQRLWTLITGTVQGVVATLVVITGVFYSLLYGPITAESATYLLPAGPLRQGFRATLAHSHSIMQGFIRGQVLLGIITGIYMGLVYSLFGVPYALLLAVLFAFVEILPVVGTWLGIIPGMLVAYMSGGLWVLAGVWICSYLYQTIKDNVVAPKVVGDLLGLHPMAIVVAILGFGKLFGLLGVVYAMPICALVWLGWKAWVNGQNDRNNSPLVLEGGP